MLTFFFITSLLNLALGYGLALYLRNPFAVEQPATENEEVTQAVRSEEEIHKLLNDHGEEETTADSAVEAAPQAPDTVEPSPPFPEPVGEVSSETTAAEAVTEVSEAEDPSEQESASLSNETDDQSEMIDHKEIAADEATSPDIAAWQEQLLEQAKKNQLGELTPPTSSVDEQPPTPDASTKSHSQPQQDLAQLESTVAAPSGSDNAEPEAEVLAGIEAFRNQLAGNLKEATESQPVEQVAEPEADSTEPAIPADSTVAAEEASEQVAEESTPEAEATSVGEVENVDADVMAGIDAFRQQLAAMRGE